MTRARPSAVLSATALLAAALLAGCTAPPDPTGTDSSTPEPTPETLVAALRLPEAPTTVLPGTGADLAVATSQALFETSPIAVLAPADDLAAQTTAASAAVALGGPLLLVPAEEPAGEAGPSATASATADPSATASEPTATADATSSPQTPGWLAELDRLGVVAVVAVGLPTDATTGLGTSITVLDDADLPTLLAAPATAWTTGSELATVAALDRDRPVALVDGAPSATPSATPSADESDASSSPETPEATPTGPALPPLALADLPGDGVLLTDGDPATLAAVATARAAGLPVVAVPGGDPRASSASVQAVASAVGEAGQVLAAGPAFAAYPDPAELDWRVRAAATGVELPGGGQIVFPGRRLVALYGAPGVPALGLLGEQDVDAAIVRAQEVAAQYQALTTDTVVPGFEIIATVAAAGAGPDGNYSDERPVEDLVPWVEAAQAAGVYVILDLQPGRTDFLTQAQRYESLLAYPNVGLALDPEWRLKPDQVHLRQIGSVTAAEVNAVSAWLAQLTRANHLPQKVLVLHQFAQRMISERETLDLSHPELATVLHVDGQGTQPGKAGTWAALRQGAPAGLWWGWKNFIDEDLPTLTPEQTYQVQPVPDLVTYQ